MNITQIEEIVKKLASDIIASQVNKDEFIYQLMAAYGHRKTTIGRIKSGERNLAKVEGEVRAKRHIYFKQSQNDCVLLDIDNMKKEPSVTRDKIRFVIATDFNQFVAIDTRTHDTLDIEFTELGKHFDFFLPWAGMEKAVYQGENPADVKAAEKMAKLFDLIKADNFNEESKNDTAALHNLNVFLTRLLFCFFAEDTGIFKQNQFSAELESHTKVDGSDVDSYLNRLFEVLNTSKETRGDLPDYLANFEYVNGGLFATTIASPRFSTKSRKMLVECGSELDWSDINPDIFGSMIQAVVHPDQRGGMGMHYTSVTNIMKVIEPLFLDELYAEFENIEDNIDAKLKPSRLRKLHDRIAEIKIFDPACGSGNFLIIAFKELRKLEMEIIKRLQELDQNENQDDLFGDVGLDSSFSRIKLSQFYGIELDDFAHEVAILSLWLAEHQMNVEFKAEFGECEPSLPLKQSGNIFSGNATRIDWESVCPLIGQVYIIGNPPYRGKKEQSDEQKEDMKFVFSRLNGYKNLDFISCWFLKAANYIGNSNALAAFVTTNSITQGEQVGVIWPELFTQGISIAFAHTSFMWKNNAKENAGVAVVIIGIGNDQFIKEKYIFENSKTATLKKKVVGITPYLSVGSSVVVTKRAKPISNLPEIANGSMANDDGNFFFSKDEFENLDQNVQSFCKKAIGAREFYHSIPRYCLWLDSDNIEDAKNFSNVIKIIEEVKKFRSKSPRAATRKLANVSHRFGEVRFMKGNALLVPGLSAESREYYPLGFTNDETIVTNLAQVIYGAELWLFSLLSSKMNIAWVETTSGYFKKDIRYSPILSYNNFPAPKFSEEQLDSMSNAALKILMARENYSDKTIAQLYDPIKMPEELKIAHRENDILIDEILNGEICSNDEDRLECLFARYSKMIGNQNA